jgi:hypothetical protein
MGSGAFLQRGTATKRCYKAPPQKQMARRGGPFAAGGTAVPACYSGVMFAACLPFGPCFTSKLTFREMCEQIFAAAVRRDETKTLCIIEPLHNTGCHFLIHSI